MSKKDEKRKIKYLRSYHIHIFYENLNIEFNVKISLGRGTSSSEVEIIRINLFINSSDLGIQK